MSPQLLSNNVLTSEFGMEDGNSSVADKFETSKQTYGRHEDSISNHLHTQLKESMMNTDLPSLTIDNKHEVQI